MKINYFKRYFAISTLLVLFGSCNEPPKQVIENTHYLVAGFDIRVAHEGTIHGLSLLNAQGLGQYLDLDVQLQDFSVQSGSRGDVSWLMASDTTGKYSVGIEMMRMGTFWILKTDKFCICEGCRAGCNLTFQNDRCMCTPCEQSTGGCVKTESASVDM